MKKPKNPFRPIDWKSRCQAAERCADLLRIEKEGAIEERDIAKAVVASRPFREKVVEKKVLPPWFVGAVLGLFVGFVIWVGFCSREISKLQEPILKPYPVELSRQRGWEAALAWQDRCQRAWAVLKDHHSGHYNGIAWRILDGQHE